MKTIEQQKAELLDSLMEAAFYPASERNPVKTARLTFDAYKIWQTLESTAPKESTNPYIDEIFNMRICNVISDVTGGEVKKIRLSDCPHISEIEGKKNIGVGSLQLYESTMQKYGLNEKLI